MNPALLRQNPKQSFAETQPSIPGLLKPGNIDLNARPIVRNPDGSISTVRSMSVNMDGKEVLLPTVSDDGKILEPEEAIDLFKQTGKHLGVFADSDSATRYALKLHEDQQKLYEKADTTGSPSRSHFLNQSSMLTLDRKAYQKMLERKLRGQHEDYMGIDTPEAVKKQLRLQRK